MSTYPPEDDDPQGGPWRGPGGSIPPSAAPQWHAQPPPPQGQSADAAPQHYAGAYPAPPTPRRRRRKWPWIVAALLLVGGAVAIGSGASPKDPGGAASTSSAAAARPGQPVTEGQLRMTVTGVKYTTKTIAGSRPSGQWAVVAVSITNTGDSPQAFYTDAQEGWVGDKRYSPDTGATAGLAFGSGSKVWYTDIQPGNSVKGSVIYDLPKGKRLTRLVLHENPTSEGVEVTP